MDKKYYLKVDGKCIPVTEKVYRTYQQPKWKEKKQAEVRIKKEVSLDLMMETGSFIQPHLGQALVEDVIMEKLLLDELHLALMQLTNDERSLIFEMFYNKKTEREMAMKIGISPVAIHKRKHKIIAKLKNILKI